MPRTTPDDLRRIVDEGIEEGTHLEFKRQLPESGKNDDLARDLALLANTEGGTIIYGIEEEDGRAKRLAPFDIKGAPERVELIAQGIDEPPTVHTSTIASEEDKDKGFLVVEVPRSDRAPHLVRGLALGRGGRTTIPVTRRQLGEMFARQSGFAEEFGLIAVRPPRVVARMDTEPYQESDHDGRLRTRRNRYLIIENDGGSDAINVDWRWASASTVDEREGCRMFFRIRFLASDSNTGFRSGCACSSISMRLPTWKCARGGGTVQVENSRRPGR